MRLESQDAGLSQPKIIGGATVGIVRQPEGIEN